MVNEETNDSDVKKPAGGKGKLLLWIGVVLAAIGGGVATPVVIAKLNRPASETEDTLEVEDFEPEEEMAYIEFGEVTVNLNEARFSKYLRMKFSLAVSESRKSEIEEQVNDKKIVFENWIQVHLSDKSFDDLEGTYGRNLIAREMRDFFNATLFKDGIERVHEILFKEFHVQ